VCNGAHAGADACGAHVEAARVHEGAARVHEGAECVFCAHAAFVGACGAGGVCLRQMLKRMHLRFLVALPSLDPRECAVESSHKLVKLARGGCSMVRMMDKELHEFHMRTPCHPRQVLRTR